MAMARRFLLISLSLALIAVTTDACSTDASPTPPAVGVVRFSGRHGTATLSVRIADDETERERGLMGAERLAPDHGMAFIWSEPTQAAFWMKDTLIPLSIAFWDESGRVVATREMSPCVSDPCATYGSPVPYVGAAEASRGWFEAKGIRIGDRANLEVNR